MKFNTEIGVYFESPEYAQIISNVFDQQALVESYQLLLKDGGLEWYTVEDGKDVRYDKEPETGFWTRFNTRFLSFFVPESQL